MPFSLTPHHLVAMYELCRALFPRNWRLPPGEEVEFRASPRTDVCGKWNGSDPHVIIVSYSHHTNKDFLAALYSMAHEAVHLVEDIAGKPPGHGAGFKRRIKIVARVLGCHEKDLA